MVKIPVYLRDMYDAKHLVQIAESCRGDVDLLCGRYVVDAKSMLGVFSLPTFEQVEISVGEEEAEFAREKLESLNLITAQISVTEKARVQMELTIVLPVVK